MGRKPKDSKQTQSYRHGDTRKNIPEAGLVEFVPKARETKKEYCWDPRESPQLIWAGKAGMKKVEVEEAASIEVPIFDLHIHERVSTEAILRTAQRADVNRSLFADPELDFQKEIQFYKHDVDWSNRMILGDSLLVMNSLLEREGMRGQVQCIYMDPPYGIKYASNFQPRIDQRDVKDGKDEDLTREVMQVQAFRDTWELGVHSYLTYLRDRLLLCRELLKDEGSIFVQIGDENVHRVRCLMDEVFGEENFVAQIPFRKKLMPLGTNFLEQMADTILWCAKQKLDNNGRPYAKYRKLFRLVPEEPDSNYRFLELDDKSRRPLTKGEREGEGKFPEYARIYRLKSMEPSGPMDAGRFKYEFQGKTYGHPANGYATTPDGMKRLEVARRVEPLGSLLNYVLFLEDGGGTTALTAPWFDTAGADDKQYAVQTNTEVVKRCILMTTDPGDLVLDPTCGSGTTAYVAEQWGRRWITMDTSRVALAIARHRLMTAAFDYYKLRHPTSGVSGGFVYKTVPHITLKSIAQNREIDEIAAEFQPQIAEALTELNSALRGHGTRFKVSTGGREGSLVDFTAPDDKTVRLPSGQEARVNALLEWEVPREFPDDWPKKALGAHDKFWRLKREMQARIDESIARNAPVEELVDQPLKEPGIVRVSGPFTIEAVPNVSAEISAEVETEVIPSDEGSKEVVVFTPREPDIEAANAAAHVGNMIEALRKTGVNVRGHKMMFENLRPLNHEVIHAEGELTINGLSGTGDPDIQTLQGKEVRCAVVFGPKNGALSEVHVRDAVRAAAPYDAILFCAYEFTAPAQEVINSDPVPGKRLLMAQIAPDTVMADLLKNTKTSQLFTLVGEPDVVVYRYGDPDLEVLASDAAERAAEVRRRLKRLKPGEVFIEVRGVDLYDPITGETKHDSGRDVHAIFIDHDYDGKSFCICQALFPNKRDSWQKIERNLKGTIDAEAFEAMRTQVSLPFEPGERIQVKVIDTRGNAVVKTIYLAEAPA